MRKTYLFIACLILGFAILPVAAEAEGECTTSRDCEVKEYCKKPAEDCKGVGACTPRPDVCPDVVDPVCGCDGQTYGNECEAAMARVNVFKKGECATCEKKGECNSNSDCDEGSFCQKRVGDCFACSMCQEKPDFCTQQYDPVCGCDGETYSNTCDAHSHGVSVSHKGECTSK
jgi:hypothetical protein